MKLKPLLKRLYSGPWYKRTIVWFCTIVIALLLLLVAVDINFLWLFGKSPGFAQIKHPETQAASEIYTCDSVIMGRFYNENRTPVTYEDLSPILIRTLIATEDNRFYHHHGVDIPGLLSAVKDMALGHARGASTITQQLAKNLFRVRTQYSTGLMGHIPGIKILVMKAKEWIVATKLEMLFSKEEILTMYFNTVDFGSNSFGIKTAARTYFGTTPRELNYEQCATLVGLLKATSSYNPRLNPELSTERRNVVLQNLYEQQGLILNGEFATQEQLDSLQAIPMQCVNSKDDGYYDGLAPYIRQELQEHLNKLCDMGLITGYENERLDLYSDGLTIYTTIDSRMQRYAEESAQQQMRTLQHRFEEHWHGQTPWRDSHYKEIPHFIENIAKKTSYYKQLTERFPNDPDSVEWYMNQPHRVKLFTYDGPIYRNISTMDSIRYMVSFLHCGFVAIEPDTRHVKAWVGDIGFDFWEYDKVTALRQPGSTFKLFVYTEAMKKGLRPCDLRLDSYAVYGDSTSKSKNAVWIPHNANGRFTGAHMTLKQAFAQSVNSIAVKLGYEVGIHNIAHTAHKMGIQSPLEEVPALSLGASDVSLYDLVNAYCTVVDDGMYSMPMLIAKIVDRHGRIIYRAYTERERAISYRSAFFMQQMLMGGMTQPGGTSQGLWQYINSVSRKTQFGGKTGTSNNHSDAWFVGITPKLVAGGWVGGEYRSIHFRTGQLGQGSRTALPIFGRFITKVLSDKRFSKYCVNFAPPKEEINRSDYECARYVPQPVDTSSHYDAPMEGVTFDNMPLEIETLPDESSVESDEVPADPAQEM
ncbi:MAG: penicillin-binding protein [Bacteroidales bacterium]|nr:penicillin-binding protein [Bacteroidales bacterium]